MQRKQKNGKRKTFTVESQLNGNKKPVRVSEFPKLPIVLCKEIFAFLSAEQLVVIRAVHSSWDMIHLHSTHCTFPRLWEPRDSLLHPNLTALHSKWGFNGNKHLSLLDIVMKAPKLQTLSYGTCITTWKPRDISLLQDLRQLHTLNLSSIGIKGTLPKSVTRVTLTNVHTVGKLFLSCVTNLTLRKCHRASQFDVYCPCLKILDIDLISLENFTIVDSTGIEVLRLTNVNSIRLENYYDTLCDWFPNIKCLYFDSLNDLTFFSDEHIYDLFGFKYLTHVYVKQDVNRLFIERNRRSIYITMLKESEE